MPQIPVRIGQENKIKVITAFGAPGVPYLAVNATNVVGGIVTCSSLYVDGTSNFVGGVTFAGDVIFEGSTNFTEIDGGVY
jgi:hypothetical protein